MTVPRWKEREMRSAAREAKRQIAELQWDKLSQLSDYMLTLLLEVAKHGLEHGPRQKWPEDETRDIVERLAAEAARRNVLTFTESRSKRGPKK